MLQLVAAGVVLFVSTLVTIMVWPLSSRSRWNPSGRVRVSSPPSYHAEPSLTEFQHCYVTGGSSGLGLALAILLTKRGADVSIVARNEENLRKALAQLEVLDFLRKVYICFLYSSTGITGQS